MTVGELLQRTSSRELTEWQAYAALEPFGEERADYRAALIAKSIWDVQLKPAERRPLTDFLLFQDEPEPPTQEEVAAKIARAFGRPT